jgi:secreted protein with Ig-like and vWFA domain
MLKLAIIAIENFSQSQLRQLLQWCEAESDKRKQKAKTLVID